MLEPSRLWKIITDRTAEQIRGGKASKQLKTEIAVVSQKLPTSPVLT